VLNETSRTIGQNPLAEDANSDFELPWFMYEDYQSDHRYLNLDNDSKIVANKFMSDGFLVIKGDISDEQCNETITSFNELAARNASYFDPFRDENGYLQRIVNLHLTLDSLLSLFTSAKNTLKFQDQLFQRPASIYTTLYFERGSSQTIHRDTPYFTTRPEYNYFGTWFALEDANSENGCLEVIRGGHLIKEFDRTEMAVKKFGSPDQIPPIEQGIFDEYQSAVIASYEARGLKKEKIELRKGDVLIWHPQLPHGGSAILDGSKTRHSIVMHTVGEGTPVYQANAFFNPRKTLPSLASWDYNEVGDRKYVKHDCVQIMHQAPRLPSDFA
jgi:phytanoyl-CoA hydroxylase